jgi:hypothetical protein
VAVAWCVDQQVLKSLSDAGITDPQVVIITAPTDNYHINKEYRKVVPLKDLMTYIEFKASGTNKIWGFISLLNSKQTRNRYLSRDNGHFYNWVLSVDGSNWVYDTGNENKELFCATPVSVVVPDGAFANEPPKWEKQWVNFWFRQKPQDQCEYRRRRLLAYSVQPLVFFIMFLARAIMLLISSLWLSRGMSFKYLLHLIQYDMDDALEVFQGGSWAIAHLPEDDKSNDPDLTPSYVVRKLWKLPLMPMFLVPLWVLYHFHLLLWASAVVAGVMTLVALALVFASGLVGYGFDTVLNWLDKWLNKPTVAWYLDQEEIEAITCALA